MKIENYIIETYNVIFNFHKDKKICDLKMKYFTWKT